MSNTVQTFDRNRIGFIAPMYWGGGGDGDGRDMTGSAPTPRPSGLTTSHAGQSFEKRAHAGHFRDVADDAIDPETPEDVLIAIEEELGACRNGVRKPVREPRVRVNGQPLEDYLEGKPPVEPQPLPLCLTVRPPRIKRRRRRGGRGRHAQRHLAA